MNEMGETMGTRENPREVIGVIGAAGAAPPPPAPETFGTAKEPRVVVGRLGPPAGSAPINADANALPADAGSGTTEQPRVVNPRNDGVKRYDRVSLQPAVQVYGQVKTVSNARDASERVNYRTVMPLEAAQVAGQPTTRHETRDELSFALAGEGEIAITFTTGAAIALRSYFDAHGRIAPSFVAAITRAVGEAVARHPNEGAPYGSNSVAVIVKRSDAPHILQACRRVQAPGEARARLRAAFAHAFKRDQIAAEAEIISHDSQGTSPLENTQPAAL